MQNIIIDIDKAFKILPFKINDIDIFAVNLGPGDFTGSRIGISIIKIFSMLSGKKAYGYNALDVFAVSSLIKSSKKIKKKLMKGEKVIIAPLMDVRNHEIFTSIYETGYYFDDDISSGEKNKPYLGCPEIDESEVVFILKEFDNSIILKKICGNILFKKDEFADKFYVLLNRLQTSHGFNFILAGNAFHSYKELFESLLDKFENKENKKIYIEKAIKYPKARYINLLAKFDADNNSGNTNIVPFYVRDFIPFKK